jgi:hypothetical protein
MLKMAGSRQKKKIEHQALTATCVFAVQVTRPILLIAGPIKDLYGSTIVNLLSPVLSRNSSHAPPIQTSAKGWLCCQYDFL